MMKITVSTIIIVIAILAVSEMTISMDKEMEDQMKDESESKFSAVFAGGCFWCTESDFEKVNGVIDAVSGYTGSHAVNPSNKEVSARTTGHVEAVKVFYDPMKISYKKDPIRYKWYRPGSGRDKYLKKAWSGTTYNFETESDTDTMGKERMMAKSAASPYRLPDEEEIRSRLTPLQYKVVRHNGTESPFNNQYWNEHTPGIYVDIVSGEPLFSSKDKFDSGTGWPSFTRPLESEHIVEKKDRSLFMVRTEVRSKYADSHLGHLFNDGPDPTGLRYCINSASLRFIPVEKLEAEGYGAYRKHFNQK